MIGRYIPVQDERHFDSIVKHLLSSGTTRNEDVEYDRIMNQYPNDLCLIWDYNHDSFYANRILYCSKDWCERNELVLTNLFQVPEELFEL